MGRVRKEAETTELIERPSARLQIYTDSDKVPWIFAALKNQPQTTLYEGDFPEPFDKIQIVAQLAQEQLIMGAALGVGNDFNARYGSTIGSPGDLKNFLLRYPNSTFANEGQQLVVMRNQNQINGAITRVSENQIVIQRGGQAGQVTLSTENPITDLAVQIDHFTTLVQRYVNAVWNASPETDNKRARMIIGVPTLPEGAPSTYFSTFEIQAKEFKAHARPVDLNSEIGGYPDVKAAIKSIYMDMTNPDRSRTYGTQPFSNKFILVHGCEGTGKSLFPKALDKMLRERYGSKFEHFRLPLDDMLRKYGPYSAAIFDSILGHARENEKKNVPTLLHFDNLEQLVPPHQRPRGTNGNLLMFGQSTYYQSPIPPSDAEFSYYLQTLSPIMEVLRKFGHELGGESHHIVIYGESRIPRDLLPEAVKRTFRRSYDLNHPTTGDLEDILRVQIETSRKFAENTRFDPFSSDIISCLGEVALHAKDLVGRDIQQSLINIANRKKAEGKAIPECKTTAEELMIELDSMRVSRGLVIQNSMGPIGFHLPH